MYNFFRTLFVIFICFVPSMSFAKDRVALVIGVERYDILRELKNPVNDATAMEDILEELGFDVYLETNRDLRRMRRALEDFTEDAAGAELALVFFAGHGMEVDGTNMLLPKDATADSLKALSDTALPLEEVVETVRAVAQYGVIIVDACRTAPFGAADGDRGAFSIAGDIPVLEGLGRIGRADNLLFSFSAAPGQAALDGEGENSPFTESLLRHLRTPGLELRSVLTLVQQDVYDRSRARQLPYVESGLPELIFMKGPADLPERESLLLAMANLSPENRAYVERISAEQDVPLAPVFGAVIQAQAMGLSGAELENAVAKAVESYLDLRRNLTQLSASDPKVAVLREKAQEQLELGAVRTARQYLSDAAEIDNQSRDRLRETYFERTISEAQTHLLSAEAAKVGLDQLGALKAYQKAHDLFAEAYASGLFDTYDKEYLASFLDTGQIYYDLADDDGLAQNLRTLKAAKDALQSTGALRETYSDFAEYQYQRSVAAVITAIRIKLEFANEWDALERSQALFDKHPEWAELGLVGPDEQAVLINLLLSAFDDAFDKEKALKQIEVAKAYIAENYAARSADDRRYKLATANMYQHFIPLYRQAGMPDEVYESANAGLSFLDPVTDKERQTKCDMLRRVLEFGLHYAALERKDFDVAIKYGEYAVFDAEACLKDAPNSAASLQNVILELQILGETYLAAKRYPQAAETLLRAIEMTLYNDGATFQHNKDATRFAWDDLRRLSRISDAGDAETRTDLLIRAMTFLTRLAALAPDNDSVQSFVLKAEHDVARTIFKLAYNTATQDGIEITTPDPDRARRAQPYVESAFSKLDARRLAKPMTPALRDAYVEVLKLRASLHNRLGNHAARLADKELAVQFTRDLLAQGFDPVDTKIALVLSLSRLGSEYFDYPANKYYAKGLDVFLESLEVTSPDGMPDEPHAKDLTNRGILIGLKMTAHLENLRNEALPPADLEDWILRSKHIVVTRAAQKLASDMFNAPAQREEIFAFHHDLIQEAAVRRDWNTHVQRSKRAIAYAERFVASGFDPIGANSELVGFLELYGQVLRETDQFEEALAVWERELDVRMSLQKMEPQNAQHEWGLVVVFYNLSTVADQQLSDLDEAIRRAQSMESRNLLSESGLNSLRFMLSERDRILGYSKQD